MELQQFLIQPNTSLTVFGGNRNHVLSLYTRLKSFLDKFKMTKIDQKSYSSQAGIGTISHFGHFFEIAKKNLLHYYISLKVGSYSSQTP